MAEEREQFLQRESMQQDAQDNPLSQNYQLDSYEAVQRKLEQRDMEGEYLVDERDAVDGEVTDSD